ncbi:hypothetical protein [Salinigranum halophilum]|uniref:hypothetical protein n=1 Tax=Salinigranum halophilum TaxID=2565931 RepID=UPI001F1E3511|nr:hypothetical protein [Salinigranum halophilum]
MDPWPFLVVTGMAFLLVFSFGPVYLLSFGLPLPAALGVSAVTFLGLAAGAHYRLVWTAAPDLAGEVPAAARLRRIVYWAVALALVLFGLSLPFLAELH